MKIFFCNCGQLLDFWIDTTTIACTKCGRVYDFLKVARELEEISSKIPESECSTNKKQTIGSD